jgi:hypothetical protein
MVPDGSKALKEYKINTSVDVSLPNYGLLGSDSRICNEKRSSGEELSRQADLAPPKTAQTYRSDYFQLR